MGRLLTIFGGLLAVLLIPLALSGPTALLLLPAHLGLSLVVSVGATLDGFDGRPEHARRWGFFYLIATIGMVAALESAARLRGQSTAYWALPWAAVLVWGWIPPVLSGVAGAIGESRERRLAVREVQRRKQLG